MNQLNNSKIDVNNDKEHATRRAYVAPELKDLSSEETEGKNASAIEAGPSGPAS